MVPKKVYIPPRRILAPRIKHVKSWNVELLYVKGFRNAFHKYTRNPQLLLKDAYKTYLMKTGRQRHTIYVGSTLNDEGKKVHLLVKETLPELARKEFENLYRIRTGKIIQSKPRESQQIAIVNEKEIKSIKEKIPKPTQRESPLILVPEPLGFVIDKKKNIGYVVEKFISGGFTLEEINLDIESPLRRKKFIEEAGKLHRRLIERKVIHADLRPRNFLVKGNRVYLLDVEFSSFVPKMTRDYYLTDFNILKGALTGKVFRDEYKYTITKRDIITYLRKVFPDPEERKKFIKENPYLFQPEEE